MAFSLYRRPAHERDTIMKRVTLLRRRPLGKKRRRVCVRPQVELLEDRSLLSGVTLGPLVQVSGPDPFAGSTADNPAGQVGTLFPGTTVEPYFAVNPANPQNLVGIWTQYEWSNGGGRGVGIAVSMNGGSSWQTGGMQGLNLTAGGTFQRGGDSWLSFAPNGDLYFTTILVNLDPSGGYAPSETVVEKSTDGGLDWSAPITLVQSTDPHFFNDKASITADPTLAGSAYAVWTHVERKYKGPAMITRTTDGGQSWSAPSTIFDPGGNDLAENNQVLVLPNGTLTDFMNIIPTSNFTSTSPLTNGSHTMTLVLSQSSDKGTTWAKNPTTVASILAIPVTDPNTGQLIDVATSGELNNASTGYSVAEDPNNGNLYAVWVDARFSNSQHNSIAFSMSTNGGCTWSAPIQINQTPTNIAGGDQQAFMPSIAVAANGTVAVTYYDFRNPDGVSSGLPTDYWLVQGNPSGAGGLANAANWGNEVRLTNSSFNMELASVRRGYFIGDYQGLAAVGNDFDAFFAATNGTDTGDIFFRDPPAVGNAPANAPIDGSALQGVADTGSHDAFFTLVNALSPGVVSVDHGQPASSIQNGMLTTLAPQSTVPMDPSAGPVLGSSVKQLTSVAAVDAGDAVVTDDPDADDSAGLAIGEIGL
jgi:hypothetical protein